MYVLPDLETHAIDTNGLTIVRYDCQSSKKIKNQTSHCKSHPPQLSNEGRSARQTEHEKGKIDCRACRLERIAGSSLRDGRGKAGTIYF